MTNETISSKDLVNRYVYEVGRRLPKSDREDIAKELASILRETIEDASQEELASTAPDITARVLKEFGSPHAAARRYSSRPNFLIGPRLYPAFTLTLRSVLIGSGALAALLVAIQSFNGLIGGLLPGALKFLELVFRFSLSFGVVAVIVFALLERFGVEQLPDFDGADWNPFELPPIAEGDQISTIRVTFKIYVIAVLILWFNFFPEWFGVWGVSPGGIQILSAQDLGLTLPSLMINCWWVLALLKNFLILREGSMTLRLRWFEVALGVFAAVIFGLILNDLLAILDTSQFQNAFGNPVLAKLSKHLFPAINAGIILVILGETIHKAYRLVRPRNLSVVL